MPWFFHKTRLHDAGLAGRFAFRQGLWIEDLQIPPGQECSNGSLILLAVVLWRTFLTVAPRRSRPTNEAAQSEDGTLFASGRKMRRTGSLHSLAKTRCRPAFSNANKERPGDDDPKERERDGLWSRWFQRRKGSDLSRFFQVAETLCGQAHRRDRLEARGSIENSDLSRRPGECAFAQ
jgi:hypothetical protein